MIEPNTIDGARAAILHSALALAADVVRDHMKRKGAALFMGALELQLSAYEGERAALARAFPELKNGAKS